MLVSRTSYPALAAVGIVAALFVYVGCSSKDGGSAQGGALPGPAPTTDRPEKPPAPSVATKNEPFVGWPAPAGALVISGEQLGYLEPCGCTEGQHGGLLRRYDLIERLRTQRKWPLALLDLGSLIKDPNAARGGPEQTRIKFQTALKALGVLNYDALALGPEDLKIGVDEVLAHLLNMPGEKLKVVAANVSAPGFESRLVPSVRLKVGPIKIGVTAVVDPGMLTALKDPSLDLLTVKPIDDTLPAILADLVKNSQTQILLVQADPAEARKLAEKYPAFDVVVGTSTTPDPPRDPVMLNDSKTLLITVGQRGKYVGVVGLFQDEKQPYRFELVALDTRFNGPAEPMKAVIEDEFRETLKGQAIVENFPRHNSVSGAPGAAFVGADNCRFCHERSYKKWASTGHAKAYVSLEHDPKPNVIYDAECISCHTTGFEYNSGWKSPARTSYLKGNQCENCHGPGSKHCEQPDNPAYLDAMHLTAEQADKNRLCIRCHDEDNSPHFEFTKYYRRISHAGLDEYSDPRFHEPRPAKTAKPDGK
jgi:hypothetical protein